MFSKIVVSVITVISNYGLWGKFKILEEGGQSEYGQKLVL